MTLNLDRSAWQKVKFGDVVRQVKASTDPVADGVNRYVAGEHMDSESLAITRWGMVGDGYLGPAFHRKFKSGQVLYGSRRTYLRKVALADFDGVCANTTFVMESADATRLLPELVPFVMSTEAFHAHSIAESKGSVNPYVNWPDIAKYEFDLPPLDQQRRITDLLKRIERHRDALDSAISCASEAQSACVNHWLATRSGLTTRLGEVCVVRSGATPSRSQQERYFDDGTIPWVKTLDLNEGTLHETDERITETALEETSCRVFPRGTVLVAMYGGFGQIGRTAMLGVDAATNQAVSALTSLAPDLRPEFVQLVLRARRRYWRQVAASSRKDPNITKTDVENFEIPRLTLAEQDSLLGLVAIVDNGNEALLREREALVALRGAVLDAIWGSP